MANFVVGDSQGMMVLFMKVGFKLLTIMFCLIMLLNGLTN